MRRPLRAPRSVVRPRQPGFGITVPDPSLLGLNIGLTGSLVETVVGLVSLGAVKYYQSAAAKSVVGSASGYWVANIVRPDSAPGATQYIAAATDLTTMGWSHRVTSGGQLVFRGVDTGPTFVQAPFFAGWPTDGKLHIAHGLYDTSNIRQYFDGAEIGSGTAMGTSIPNTAQPFAIGHLGGGSNFWSAGPLLGFAGADAAFPTPSQISAHAAAAKAAGDIVACAGTTTAHLYSVRLGAILVPSTWPDEIGSDDLTLTGTPAIERFVPVWGF